MCNFSRDVNVPVAETTQLWSESGHNEMSRPKPTPRVLGRGLLCRIGDVDDPRQHQPHRVGSLMCPPPCLGGASRWWVQVNAHGTPAPSMNGRPWVAQATECRQAPQSTRKCTTCPEREPTLFQCQHGSGAKLRPQKVSSEETSDTVDSTKAMILVKEDCVVDWRQDVSENPMRAIDE